jgi:hypothetical protein
MMRSVVNVKRITHRVSPAAVIAALTLLLGTPRIASAHAIHTTLTQVQSGGGAVTLTIRAFADDFSSTVARFAGKPVPRDSSAADVDVVRYVRANFSITDAAGHAIPLQSCGIRRDGELYWLCFRAPLGAATAVRVVNRMLTELHADQVNILQVLESGARRTLLFTKGSAPAELRARA